jgi:hypothetical protein
VRDPARSSTTRPATPRPWLPYRECGPQTSLQRASSTESSRRTRCLLSWEQTSDLVRSQAALNPPGVSGHWALWISAKVWSVWCCSVRPRLELGGWYVAEVAMQAGGVVPVDPAHVAAHGKPTNGRTKSTKPHAVRAASPHSATGWWGMRLSNSSVGSAGSAFSTGGPPAGQGVHGGYSGFGQPHSNVPSCSSINRGRVA